MKYKIKDIVNQYGRYYFLIEIGNEIIIPKKVSWKILLKDDEKELIIPQLMISKDIPPMPEGGLMVLESDYLPEALKKWKQGDAVLYLKIFDESQNNTQPHPPVVSSRLERHKRKFLFFTWWD